MPDFADITPDAPQPPKGATPPPAASGDALDAALTKAAAGRPQAPPARPEGEPATVESLNADLDELSVAFAEVYRENGELREQLAAAELRAATAEGAIATSRSEAANVRRRTQEQVTTAQRYALEKVAEPLLNTLDNFDRAIAALPEDAPAADREALEMIRSQFLAALAQGGIERMECSGQPFDATKHQAVQTVSRDDVTCPTVVQEVRAGYRLHDRTVRPAAVIVGRPAPAS